MFLVNYNWIQTRNTLVVLPKPTSKHNKLSFRLFLFLATAFYLFEALEIVFTVDNYFIIFFLQKEG